MVFSRVLEVLGFILLSHVPIASAQNNTTSSKLPQNYSEDPFLQYQPHFARSLPVQLLIIGTVFALTSILIIHLGFTWQYHWPLGRVNWILQFTGASTLLLNVLAIILVVMNALVDKSRTWPYMFEYVAIDVPRLGSWSVAEVAAWYVMEAATSTLVSATHIQFLTFLYPSKLEARLVAVLLGPLAIVSSIMTLLPIATYKYDTDQVIYNSLASNLTPAMDAVNSSMANVSSTSKFPHGDHQQLYDIVDAARHICNLTLSFLFTLSLLIWGFFVSRKSAWRMDGGTAIFGAGALFLALISTALNFIRVFTSPSFEWLSPLLWAVILWQSFFGWWWWVGSATGIAERELDGERRRKKGKRKGRKKPRTTASSSQEDDAVATGTMARLDRWRSTVGATISRRRNAAEIVHKQEASEKDSIHESVELSTIGFAPAESVRDTASISTSASSTILGSLRRAWRSLRQAHIRAARVQAIEQHNIQLQMQLENGHGLGRFPGGPGGDINLNVFRSHGDISPPRPVQDIPRIPNPEVSRFAGVSLLQTIRKWRLRDSTTY
ncbi:hypothetical protein M422DRAFT_783817 [Sphaerobolus stellatus SS14]|uniref:Uncharacterized protein n=1 Tax=Sphaerobolus stellatus (strain SS14) TaxID=990650 RepID=A0A0C9TMR0_SPHS4|nr:hypothetical protein M422DRAFT_783817 [Sphaerobolus stellatus SS14]